jgi:hypothetical protein
VPLPGIGPTDGHAERLLRAHQHHQILAPGHGRVKQDPLEHHVMPRVQWDHHAGKLRTLALVDRQDIRQRQFVQVSEVVFYAPPLEIDDPVISINLPNLGAF